MTSFPGILFVHEQDAALVDAATEPEYFADLNLDQVVAAVAPELAPFFYVRCATPTPSPTGTRCSPTSSSRSLRAAVSELVTRLGEVHARLELARGLAHPPQKQRRLLDAAGAYCDAVRAFARIEPGSRALRGFVAQLREYVAGERFVALSARVTELTGALDEIRYTVHVQGQRVRVARYEGEADYGAELAELLGRFEGPVHDHRSAFAVATALDSVELRILDLVARQFPEPFAALAAFWEDRAGLPRPGRRALPARDPLLPRVRAAHGAARAAVLHAGARRRAARRRRL